ncbi:hypothetical protein BHS04_17225 [Myxococcus xanthus]|nr:hypothetical protein BHS04_17225 [Myxococcus xanthus]
MPVRAPRVNDKRTEPATGERKRFASALLPAWARKSPRVAEVLPLLYLHGLSSSDFGPALTQFLGTSHGLSAATSTRLTKDCIKELIAFDDGHRESTESWLDLLRGCQRRGLAAPVLAVGDGALGFWSVVREVFPETREQRCWWHKIGTVLNALLKSAQPGAKNALAEAFSALGNTDALATSRRMSRPDIGLAMTPTVASATSQWRHTRQPLACCSPIALPARRRRVCRLPDARFRSR